MNHSVKEKLSILSKELFQALRELAQKKQQVSPDSVAFLLKQKKNVLDILHEKEMDSAINQKEYDKIKNEFAFLEKQYSNQLKVMEKRDLLLKSFILSLLNIESLKEFKWFREIKESKEKKQLDSLLTFSYMESLKDKIRNEMFQSHIADGEEKSKKDSKEKNDKYLAVRQEEELKQVKEIIYQKVQHIIAEINLPGYHRLNQKSEEFLSQFLNHFDINHIADYLESLVDLLQELKYEYQIKRNEIDQFLQELLLKIFETEQEFFSQFEDKQEKAHQSNLFFHKNINNQIENLGVLFNEIDDEESILGVKDQILDSLDLIKVKFEEKNHEEQKLFESSKKELEDLKMKLEESKTELKKIKEKTKKLEEEILTDGLTGIHNRRAFDEKIDEILYLKKRYQTRFCLILIDIDLFKKINDTYGHRVGDNALIRIVRNIKGQLRKSDFFARYGGEEFAIILFDCDLEQAINTAEKIRTLIEAIRFTYRKKEHIKITISLGVSSLKKDDTEADFINRADKALYLAKDSGRNQVKAEINI